MSATLDSAAVSAFLDDCPVVDVPGRLHPLDIDYAAGQSVADAVSELSKTSSGDILCFLPGAFEIRRAIDDIGFTAAGRQAEIIALHGSLDAATQDAALRPARSTARRRIIVATNIAETSVTVPGVTAVVDSGLHKIARYDAERASTVLSWNESRPTPLSSGPAVRLGCRRAGHAGCGRARSASPAPRARDSSHRSVRHRPRHHRVGKPRRFEWFESPTEESIEAAVALLTRLGAVQGEALTAIGRQLQVMPCTRVWREWSSPRAAPARWRRPAPCYRSGTCWHPATSGRDHDFDLLSAIDRWSIVPPHVQRVAREIEQIASNLVTSPSRRPARPARPARLIYLIPTFAAPFSPATLIASRNGAKLDLRAFVSPPAPARSSVRKAV